MTLESRLERLERENRWMRRIGAVGVAVAVAVFLIGQGKEKEPPDLEVRSLTMKDKRGHIRARLFVDGRRPFLVFYSERGAVRAMYTDYALDYFLGSDQHAAIRLQALRGDLRFLLIDRGQVRADLAVADDGTRLRLNDRNNNRRAVLGVTHAIDSATGAKTTTPENTLTLYDAKGKVIWKAPED